MHKFRKALKPVKKIFKNVVVSFIAFTDSLACMGIYAKKPDAILIVRIDNIGDFILWLPYLQQLCNHYHECGKPFLVCNRTCVDFAEATRLFRTVIGVDSRLMERNLLYRITTMRKVAALGAATAIQPTYSRGLIGDLLVRASQASRRIGSQGDLSNMTQLQRETSNHWYTQLLSAAPKPMMELCRNAEFLRNLGVSSVRLEIPLIPKLVELPIEKRFTRDYFVLFPGASFPFKMWPVESFAVVAQRVIEEFAWIPVICGGQSEEFVGNRLLNLIESHEVVNMVGKTSLPELTELIRGARLVISNDTSAVHIAAGVNTPSVCILGGGHYGRFMPYPPNVKGMLPVPVVKMMDCFGCNNSCLFTNDHSRPFPCITEIRVDQVIEAVAQAIGST
jgi:ADP-heptose:LPS heptosyltransferase